MAVPLYWYFEACLYPKNGSINDFDHKSHYNDNYLSISYAHNTFFKTLEQYLVPNRDIKVISPMLNFPSQTEISPKSYTGGHIFNPQLCMIRARMMIRWGKVHNLVQITLNGLF